MHIAIIIPCYNESARIKTHLFLKFLDSHSNYSIFFVDDGSVDDTWNVLTSLKNENSERIHIIQNKVNLGKAESVRNGMTTAFRHNEFDYIGFLDADLSTPLEEFDQLTNYIQLENKKAVFGLRLKRMGADIDRRLFRHIIGRIFATFIGWTIKLPFYDTQCGAKIFHQSTIAVIIEKTFITKWLFDVEIIMRLKFFLGLEDTYRYISEYPISEWKEVKGSKLNWKDIYRIPIDLLKIKMHYTDTLK